MSFFIGLFIGGFMGVAVMSIMRIGSDYQEDDR